MIMEKNKRLIDTKINGMFEVGDKATIEFSDGSCSDVYIYHIHTYPLFLNRHPLICLKYEDYENYRPVPYMEIRIAGIEKCFPLDISADMMLKERKTKEQINITAPEGFELKEETVNGVKNITFVPKKKSVKEIVDEYRNIHNRSFYITDSSEIAETMLSYKDNSWRKNILYSPEKCEQFLALMQLVTNCWIVNGRRELQTHEIKAAIARNFDTDRIILCTSGSKKRILNFKDIETANKFLYTYIDLINTAAPLL